MIPNGRGGNGSVSRDSLRFLGVVCHWRLVRQCSPNHPVGCISTHHPRTLTGEIDATTPQTNHEQFRPSRASGRPLPRRLSVELRPLPRIRMRDGEKHRSRLYPGPRPISGMAQIEKNLHPTPDRPLQAAGLRRLLAGDGPTRRQQRCPESRVAETLFPLSGPGGSPARQRRGSPQLTEALAVSSSRLESPDGQSTSGGSAKYRSLSLSRPRFPGDSVRHRLPGLGSGSDAAA